MSKIITGIASFGMSGSVFHAPFIDLHKDFELHTIVERSKNLAKERYPKVNIVRSFDEMLAIPEIELIVVNTPDVTHFDYVKKSLEAGKHVVVEKPFVFTVAEGNKLIDLAKRRKRSIFVYHNRRWDSDFLTVQKTIREGLLGRVVEFHSAFQRYRPFVAPDTWKEQADNRVGLTYNLGTHLVDQAVQLFGMPQAVYADADILRDNGKVQDFVMIQLIYPLLKVFLRASFLVRLPMARFSVNGTLGSYIKYGNDPQEDLLKTGVKPAGENWGEENECDWGNLETEIDGKIICKKIPNEKGNYFAFYDEVFASLRKGKEISLEAEKVLPVIRILEACYESYEAKCVVAI